VTSASADPRSLLQDLRGEIGEAYGSTEPAPSTLQELQQELPKRLELASADRPLIVFLDSLDQLAGGEGTNLSWLPSDLPGSVRLVTATRPGPFLDGLGKPPAREPRDRARQNAGGRGRNPAGLLAARE
jgi:hypothetical protein